MSARRGSRPPNGTEILILVVLLWAGSWLLGRGPAKGKAIEPRRARPPQLRMAGTAVATWSRHPEAYTVLGPLLYWPVLALTQAGWDVWSIDWHADVQGPPPKDTGQFVEDAVSQALHEMPDAPTAGVGKSLGTYALTQTTRQ